MQNRQDGTSQQNPLVIDVHSGFVNVQSKTGVQLWRLEDKTAAFQSHDFGFNPSPWIPEKDWKTVADSYFPACDRSLKELVRNSRCYSDWRSAKRAITETGSCVHFVIDGPVWISTQNSYDTGMEQVVRLRRDNEARQRGGFRY